MSRQDFDATFPLSMVTYSEEYLNTLTFSNLQQLCKEKNLHYENADNRKVLVKQLVNFQAEYFRQLPHQIRHLKSNNHDLKNEIQEMLDELNSLLPQLPGGCLPAMIEGQTVNFNQNHSVVSQDILIQQQVIDAQIKQQQEFLIIQGHHESPMVSFVSAGHPAAHVGPDGMEIYGQPQTEGEPIYMQPISMVTDGPNSYYTNATGMEEANYCFMPPTPAVQTITPIQTYDMPAENSYVQLQPIGTIQNFESSNDIITLESLNNPRDHQNMKLQSSGPSPNSETIIDVGDEESVFGEMNHDYSLIQQHEQEVFGQDKLPSITTMMDPHGMHDESFDHQVKNLDDSGMS